MSLDLYGNAIELRLNAAEMFENIKIGGRDPTKFYFKGRTKVGTVPVKAVIGQLRAIAKVLEESPGVKEVTFCLEVQEP